MRWSDRGVGGESWLTWGLFLTTLATLLVELIDARLLSVITWYHLSFLALSLAMLGTSGGAVLVFLAGARMRGDAARTWLVRLSLIFALATPLTHVVLLQIPIEGLHEFDVRELLPLIVATVLLTIPFLLSGAVVTIALTRAGGRSIGRLYGFDLIGAAMGSLLVVPLLNAADPMSALLFASAAVAGGAFCFRRFAGRGGAGAPGTAALVLVIFAIVHLQQDGPFDVVYPRGTKVDPTTLELSRWNAHSKVSVTVPEVGGPFYWGPSRHRDDPTVTFSFMRIDGEAGTALTAWDGDRDSLYWVQYDVTTLPYHLRSGDVAIMGVGGGRDILSALWAGSDSILGVELNGIFLDILQDSHRDFARIADAEGVRLEHDEARSYLTRSDEQFDVIQMSLVDTWAATGAGAFTLSENALYTVEAWRVFLDRLKPDGIFSSSRWFFPGDLSETSRLVSLCVAALLDRGVEKPADHIVLVARRFVATLLVSPTPFSPADLQRVRDVVERYEFELVALPGVTPASHQLANIVAARSAEELERATADPNFDYTPPTDARPYFFNMLKIGSFARLAEVRVTGVFDGRKGVLPGNVRATTTLIALLGIALALTLAIIVLPLLRSGLPDMSLGSFALSTGYFAAIGYGFMSIQLPFLQRFSVFVGHPVYAYSIILFSMILFAGIGSLLSERADLDSRPWHVVVPLAVTAALLLLSLSMQPVLDATIGLGIAGRAAVVVALTAPVSTLLGFCFPFGIRLVTAISDEATPWMWGINGACGVVASILAVVVSMSAGIHRNLLIAGILYALVAAAAYGLQRGATQGAHSSAGLRESK